MPSSQEWWRDLRCHFGELTEDNQALTHREDIRTAIEFICAELALTAGAKILDLCCGPGKYAIELAHRGFTVVGIDLSENYVSIARRVAEKEGQSVQFLMSDMREIPFVCQFDAVINVGTSYGFFDAEDDNKQVIKAVAKSLKPGGAFLLEMANREYYSKNFGAIEWRRRKDGSVMLIQREFDYIRGRIDTTFETLSDGKSVAKWHSSWRAYTLAEVAAMLKDANLILSSVFGDWARNEYSVDSKRMVVISKKSDATQSIATKNHA